MSKQDILTVIVGVLFLALMLFIIFSGVLL